VISDSAHLSTLRVNPRREVFTVSGEHVTFDGERWRCECTDCWPNARCAHIATAERLRHLRRKQHASSPAEPASTHYVPPPPDPTEGLKRELFHGRLIAVVAVVVAGLGTTVLASFSSDPIAQMAPAPVAAATRPVIAPAPVAVELPAIPTVKFVNPFDASEIFEFPAGTSTDEARDHVATFLMERARHRHATAPTDARSLSASTSGSR
jgi:hypothetical protein